MCVDMVIMSVLSVGILLSLTLSLPLSLSLPLALSLPCLVWAYSVQFSGGKREREKERERQDVGILLAVLGVVSVNDAVDLLELVRVPLNLRERERSMRERGASATSSPHPASSSATSSPQPAIPSHPIHQCHLEC